MCGIVGVVGNNEAVNIVLDGLKRLEYRGYDSAGIASLLEGEIELRKAAGKISALEELLNSSPFQATTTAMGHTRWATHGEPSTHNAHPHQNGHVAVVHNGIIENFQTLRTELEGDNIHMLSETDTETIPAMVNKYLTLGHDLIGAVQATIKRAEGAFALGIECAGHTDQLIAARRGAPLCLGVGEGCNFIASDPLALAGKTNKFIYLEDDDVALLTPSSIQILRPDGEDVTSKRPVKVLDLSGAQAGKAGHRHFMMKEIYEQPAVTAQILSEYLDAETHLPKLPQMPCDLSQVPQINIIACGTAYYAGMVAKYFFEQLAGVPVNVDVASEFRYRKPPYKEGGAFIAISQSGETADTLAALEDAKANGQHILSVTNTPTSSIARASDAVLEIMAGPEIAVASTKAFMGMIVTLALMALDAAKNKGLPQEQLEAYGQALRELPAKLSQTLEIEKDLEALAMDIMHATSMLYLGRGMLQPLAFEGALKMKEISYIHAEGYASGEMKHGPIALVDEGLPVVNLATVADGLFDKTVSNMKEIEARRGQVILFTDAEGKEKLDKDIAAKAKVYTLPINSEITAPMLFSIPLQLLSYHVAVAKGTDVDQPRNLAKSVTVE